MEESQSKQESNTRVAQHGSQQDVDPTFQTKRALEKERSKPRPRPLPRGKNTKNPHPSLCDPFITTEPYCQGFHGQASLLSEEFAGPGEAGIGRLSEASN